MLKGQSFGPYAGTNSGDVIVEFDEVEGQLVGAVTVYPGDIQLPAVFSPVVAPLNASTLDVKVPISPIDATGELVPWANVARFFPNMAMPSTADTK
jgi:hypothetical protein